MGLVASHGEASLRHAPPCWGQSTHFDIAQCQDHLELFMGDRIHKMMSEEFLQAFIEELIELIDMKRYGPPMIQYFGTDDAKGWSVMQLIETSCVTMHTCDESQDVYLDIFSCKRFDPEIVKGFIQAILMPLDIKYMNIGRQARR